MSLYKKIHYFVQAPPSVHRGPVSTLIRLFGFLMWLHSHFRGCALVSARRSTFREVGCLIALWSGLRGRPPLSFSTSSRTGAGFTRECNDRTVSRLYNLSKVAGPKWVPNLTVEGKTEPGRGQAQVLPIPHSFYTFMQYQVPTNSFCL